MNDAGGGPVVLVGAGGHARVVHDALVLGGTRIVGVVDPSTPRAPELADYEYLSSDSEVATRFPSDEVSVAIGIGCVPGPQRELRAAICARYHSMGYRIVSVIHPTATVSSHAHLGIGVQIMAGAIIQPGTSIGDHSIVNSRASIDHDCSLGALVHVAPGATLCGEVEIGEGSFVGAGAILLPGTQLSVRGTARAGTVYPRRTSANV